MSVRANDRKFVYFERRKKLELRFEDLSAAKKVKIEHYKAESEKMAALEAEMESVAVRNGKMDEMIAALKAKEEEIENQEVWHCPLCPLRGRMPMVFDGAVSCCPSSSRW